MQDPAARSPVLASRLRTGVGHVAHQCFQRPYHLRKIARFGWPIVHGEIDVHRVLRVPPRILIVVPDALQIGRLRAGPRTRDEEISAELVVQRRQLRVRRIGISFHPQIGGKCVGRCSCRPERELHPTEPGAMFGQMIAPHCANVARAGAGECGAYALGGVRSNRPVVHKARMRRQCERYRVGARHPQRAVVHVDIPSLRVGNQPRFVRQRAPDAEVVGVLAGEPQRVRRQPVHLEIVGTVVRMGRVAHSMQLRRKRYGAGSVGREAHNQQLIHRA